MGIFPSQDDCGPVNRKKNKSANAFVSWSGEMFVGEGEVWLSFAPQQMDDLPQQFKQMFFC